MHAIANKPAPMKRKIPTTAFEPTSSPYIMSVQATYPVKVRVIVTQFIQTDAMSFKSVVQRLTGRDSNAAPAVAIVPEGSHAAAAMDKKHVVVHERACVGVVDGCWVPPPPAPPPAEESQQPDDAELNSTCMGIPDELQELLAFWAD